MKRAFSLSCIVASFALLSGVGRAQTAPGPPPELQADGNFVDTESSVSPNVFRRGFRDPRVGLLRFTITIDAQQRWFEIGEYSRDEGVSWTKNFEMTLTRVAAKG